MHCIFCAILAGGAKSDRRLGENVQMQCCEIVQTVKSCIHSECHCANCTWIVQISKGCSVSGRLCCTASSPGKGCSIGVQRTAAASSGRASATSGFGFGILKAVEQGIVPESYRANAMRALQPVLDCIDEKGVVQQVSYGTPMGRESKDFYKQIPLHPMPYGQAMAILFLMEAEAQV